MKTTLKIVVLLNLVVPAAFLLVACSKSSDELYGAGMRALRRGEEETAFDRFTAAVETNPDDVESLLELGKLYLRRPDGSDRAREMLERAVKLDPREVEAHYLLGRIYYDAGNTKEAAIRFKSVVDSPPRPEYLPLRQQSRQQIMQIFQDTRNREELEELEEQLQEVPDNTTLMMELARKYRELGRDALVQKGNERAAEELLARYRELRAELLPVIRAEWEESPEDSDQRDLLAELYYEAGEERLWAQDLKTAADFLRQAVEVKPDEGKYYFILAQLLTGLDENSDLSEETMSEVADLLEQAVRYTPDIPRYWQAYARALDRTGNPEAAGEALEEGIEHNPEAPELHLSLAGSLQSRGHEAEALARLELVVNEFPQSQEAAAARALLKQLEVQESTAN